jgi:hypothetical protein
MSRKLFSLYREVLNNNEMALVYLDTVIRFEPQNAFLFIAKSRILREMGRTAESCQALREAQKIADMPELDGMLNFFNCDQFPPE